MERGDGPGKDRNLAPEAVGKGPPAFASFFDRGDGDSLPLGAYSGSIASLNYRLMDFTPAGALWGGLLPVSPGGGAAQTL